MKFRQPSMGTSVGREIEGGGEAIKGVRSTVREDGKITQRDISNKLRSKHDNDTNTVVDLMN